MRIIITAGVCNGVAYCFRYVIYNSLPWTYTAAFLQNSISLAFNIRVIDDDSVI